MGAMGRDPEFFKYVEGSVAERILGRVEQALITIPAEENPYLEYILRGEFRQSLPFYLRPENFQRIKRNLNKLVLFQGSIEDAMKAHRPVAFDGFNLSDIFEYMDGPLFRSQLAGIVERSADRARLVYWNMLADRNARLAGEGRLASLDELSRSLLARDKAFFYKAVVVEEVRR